jgi:hypothetical protein
MTLLCYTVHTTFIHITDDVAEEYIKLIITNYTNKKVESLNSDQEKQTILAILIFITGRIKGAKKNGRDEI